jgi:hypothetical protein
MTAEPAIDRYDAERQIAAWLKTGRVPSPDELHTLSPVQLAASRSRTKCGRCGHEERYHTVPLDDEPRDCWPPEKTDWDLKIGEEVVVDGGGCFCETFDPAPDSFEARFSP